MKNKKPAKVHWIYNDLYFFNIYLCYKFTKEEYAKQIFKQTGYRYERDAFMPPGMVTELENQNGTRVIFIYINTDDLDCLVHECVHAAHAIMDHRGLKSDHRNDEAEAYLTSWLFRKCYDFILKRNGKK